MGYFMQVFSYFTVIFVTSFKIHIFIWLRKNHLESRPEKHILLADNMCTSE